MSYYCKAPRDCGCTLWDHGKVCGICIEDECLDLIETYDFRKCECGSEDTPSLYGEGMARQDVKHKGDNQSIRWHRFDGFVVECDNCGATTAHFATPEQAAAAWNEHRLDWR